MSLNISVVNSIDLSSAWFDCILEVVRNGYEYTIDKGSYAGRKRKELDLVVVRILHPSKRPLAPFTREGIPAPTTDEDIENYLLYLMTNDKKVNEQYTYGEDLAPQIEHVIETYKKSGYENNQMCMTLGSWSSVFLDDPQCLRLVDTRVRYGKLHFVVYFRSWDLYAGFPVNLGGLQLLKEYMASQIGVEDGDLVAVSKGLHLYDHFWSLADEVLGNPTISKLLSYPSSFPYSSVSGSAQSLVNLLPVEQDPITTLGVMTYELGYVAHGLIYGTRRPDLASTYLEESRINLADLITQCRLLSEQLGWSFSDLWRDGEERFGERMREVEKWKIEV